MPPYFCTMIGKRQMLPIPTAEPIHARNESPLYSELNHLCSKFLGSLLIILHPFNV